MATSQAVQVEMVGNPTRSKGLHVTLWIVQVLLAFAFGLAGLTHATKPIEELAKTMGWPGDVPESFVRFIGSCEVAAALGLLLPALTRIAPALTPWAAIGLVALMVAAGLFHLTRGEARVLPVNVVLGGLAAFIAWGRFRRAPILPRA